MRGMRWVETAFCLAVKRLLMFLLQVVLSALAEDESGTRSSSAPPKTLTQPCEFNARPTGSPPEGHDASDSRL